MSIPKSTPARGTPLPAINPHPAFPVSTGLIHVKPWKGKPEAKSVYVDDQRIIARAPGGSVLGSWELPGNLPVLLEGLTKAFGHSPLGQVTGSWGWEYSWNGFIIRDGTPGVVGPTDPPYQWSATAPDVHGVLVHTVKDIHVGNTGDLAAAIADQWSVVGFFVAELLPVPVSIPTTGSPRLWVEITGGATQHDPIVEMRGPVGSWLS